MNQPVDADHETWIEGLVTRYEKPLCSYACSMLRDPDRARDAVQETFLRLCRERREKLDGREAGWLFRVCRNRAVDILRKEKPVKALTEEHQALLASGTTDPAGAAEAHDALSLLARLMARLPERQREVIRLKFQQQLSYREIAETLELSVSNVGFLMHTGLKTLRQEFKAAEGA